MLNKFKSNKMTIGILGKNYIGKTYAFTALTHFNLPLTKDVTETIENTVEKEVAIFDDKQVNIIDCVDTNISKDDVESKVELIKQVISKSDVILLLSDFYGWDATDKAVFKEAAKSNVTVISVVNKIDMCPISDENYNNIKQYTEHIILTSLKYDKDFVEKVKEEINKIFPTSFIDKLIRLFKK